MRVYGSISQSFASSLSSPVIDFVRGLQFVSYPSSVPAASYLSGFASQLCGICEEKKVHAVKRMARLAEQQLIRGWLA
ncbi:unnamed protein product [Rhodiola kirilowii]